MQPLLKKLTAFSDWDQAERYLAESPFHFLAAQEYPPEHFPAGFRPRLIIQGFNHRAGFHHFPAHADWQSLESFCHLLMGQSRAPVAGDLSRFLQSFADLLRGKSHFQDVAKDLIAETSRHFNADGAAILVLNETKDALNFAATYSRNQDVKSRLSQIAVPMGYGIAGWVAAHREPALVNQVRLDRRFNGQVDEETDYHTKNLIAAPIVAGGELIGVIEVLNKKHGEFHEHEISTLSVVATLVAIFSEKMNLGLQKQHFDRATDRAQVASSLLHNIGNVLNSVRVSCSLMETELEKSKTAQLHKAAALVGEWADQPDHFFAVDPKGKLFPDFLGRLAGILEKERATLGGEIAKIDSKTQLMKDIIETQQTDAKLSSPESQDLIQLIERAIGVQRDFIRERGVQIHKHYCCGKPVRASEAKLTHILINLLKNAVEAMEETAYDQRLIHLETGEDGDGCIFIRIRDQGMGMEKDVVDKAFTHGFTTKKNGHGFGLHYCAQAMEEMHGAIQVESPGRGKGTTFTLTFPPVPVVLTEKSSLAAKR